MEFHIVTLFPAMLQGWLEAGVVGRALRGQPAGVVLHNLRDYGLGNYRQVDDQPYGGGSGMVLRPEPVAAAIDHALSARPGLHRILLTPQGARFDQERARRYAGREPGLLLIAGRYEGIDERVRELVDEELSIGDYILNGGELAAMVVVEAVCRLLPGVLGNAHSLAEESFGQGLLEYPQYTRPEVFRGLSVPEVLLSGDHARIRRWRQEQAERRTRDRRPDLLNKIARG
ncbi:MAG TPA: tRNA (guanosine(37)-N1)-methyltransferase TrmD [Candidatus Binataceae bacterium]|nr:tRNA (guanosine(37)-N1)-methyltransferase TrmD [Candidatus Binataceae bacterium]